MTSTKASPSPTRTSGREMVTSLPELLTVTDVALILKVSTRTVTRMIKAGMIPVIRIGGVIRIRADDLAALLRPQ
jgi:excisionase family DNA binding protein